MSGPPPVGCAKNADYPERKKERANNISIKRPSEDRAEERQSAKQGKVSRFGVHFALGLKGAATRAAPSSLREPMALSPSMTVPRAEGQAIFLRATEPRAARPGRNPPRGAAF
jgi:hypothetical protein